MIKIINADEMSYKDILSRDNESTDIAAVVSDIIANVRENGDEALAEYELKFGGASPKSLEVSSEERETALSQVEPQFIEIMKEAAENIKKYHSLQIRSGYEIREKEGIILGQKITPIASVGTCVKHSR